MALKTGGTHKKDVSNRSISSGTHAICLLLLTFSCLLNASGVDLKSLASGSRRRINSLATTTSGFAVQVSLPPGVVGKPYSGSFLATGGVAPYTFAIVDGTLPKGLSLKTATGAVTGTPTAAGTNYFRVRVTDAHQIAVLTRGKIVISGGSSTSTISVSISPTSSSLLGGSAEQFSASVQGTSSTAVTWSATSGTISERGFFTAPKVTNSTNVTVTAISSADATKKASATVSVSAPTTTDGVRVTVSPASTTLISGGKQQFSASVQGTTNTSVTWSATGGSISSSGVFTAPTVSTNSNFTITATSVANTTQKASVNVSVNPGASLLAITTSSIPSALSSTAYFYTLAASGGTTPYNWSLSGGSLPTGLTLSSAGQLSGTTTQTGSFAFIAIVKDSASASVSKSFSLSVSSPSPSAPPPSSTPTSSGYDGPAELPRIYMQTSLANTPAPGSTIQVGSGGSLQTALNSANCGDTIALSAGATFSGIFSFPAKACDDQHWIIVRTSAPNSALPAEGSRLLPCYAGVSSLPGRPAFNCSTVKNVMAQISDPQTNSTGPIVFAPGATHYRFIGLEITRTTGTGIDYQLVSVPSGTADHIIFDRVWLHGTPQDETKNGITLSGMSYVALIDSYSSDFHCTSNVGACTDAKVVGGGNSNTVDGVFKITNNYLEASGENILFGGGSATTTPADIEIRHNHFYKPLIWMQGQPGYVGGASGYPFMVKNLLELKNAQRVLVEGNIFEYSWGGFSQNGYGILLTPKNQASGCPICEVTDVTLRYNTLSHTGAGISMANVPDDNGAIASAGERYSIHDMTIDDINMKLFNGSGTLFQVVHGWPTNPLNNVSINHVTGFPDPGSKIMSLSNSTTNQQMSAFTLTNSIIGQALYPIWSAIGNSTDCSTSDIPLISLNTCFTSYNYSENAMIAVNFSNYPTSKWPANNSFPSTAGAVQFTNFNGGNGGNYTLLSTSPYKNAASDGKDLGADISAIQAAIAGVY